MILHFSRGCAFWYLDTRQLQWLRQQINTVTNKRSFHDAMFIPSESVPWWQSESTNSNYMYNDYILTQSKIPLFVLKHLASYTLFNYPKRAKNGCRPFVPVNTWRTWALNYLPAYFLCACIQMRSAYFLCACVLVETHYCRCNSKKREWTSKLKILWINNGDIGMVTKV